MVTPHATLIDAPVPTEGSSARRLEDQSTVHDGAGTQSPTEARAPSGATRVSAWVFVAAALLAAVVAAAVFRLVPP
jgi:hypothetical protein